jgi:uncharacterized protein YceH (UPF0502 family)
MADENADTKDLTTGKTEEERLRERQAVTASLSEQPWRRLAQLEAEVAELKARIEALEAKNVSARKGSAK